MAGQVLTMQMSKNHVSCLAWRHGTIAISRPLINAQEGSGDWGTGLDEGGTHGIPGSSAPSGS